MPDYTAELVSSDHDIAASKSFCAPLMAVSMELFTAPDVIRFVLLAVTVVSIFFVVTALVPLPIRAYPEVNVVAPVPPLDTGSVPLVISEAACL